MMQKRVCTALFLESVEKQEKSYSALKFIDCLFFTAVHILSVGFSQCCKFFVCAKTYLYLFNGVSLTFILLIIIQLNVEIM